MSAKERYPVVPQGHRYLALHIPTGVLSTTIAQPAMIESMAHETKSSALANLDGARTMLEKSRTLPEVKKIRDVAEAAKVYVKAARLGRDSQLYAAEISLIASHKAGGILKELPRAKPKAKGGRFRDSEYQRTLNEARVSYRTAQHWQKLASVPEEDVKRYIDVVRKSEKDDITAAGLLRAVRPKKSKSKSKSPFSDHITIPLKRHEYYGIRSWARVSYEPDEFLTSEAQFVRAIITEFFQQTGLAHWTPLQDETSIREALAAWLKQDTKTVLAALEEVEKEKTPA